MPIFASESDALGIFATEADILGIFASLGEAYTPSGPTDHEVDTIAEALALTVAAGDTVTVAGYDAAGDGGGGVFGVTDTGGLPDGGMIFAPNSEVSAEVSESWSFSSDTYTVTGAVGEHIVHGTYELDLVDPAGPTVLETIPGALTHGHRWQSRLAIERPVDTRTGTLRDTHRLIFNYFARELGGGRDGTVTVRYKHTTGNLRLVRQGVTDTLNIRWYGAKTHAEDATANNRNTLCHVCNRATDINAVAPGTITTILAPNVGGVGTVYEYFGAIQVPSGVTIKGDAGTEVVDATSTIEGVAHGLANGVYTVNASTTYTVAGDTITVAYRPVRKRSDATTLRVKTGEALAHVYMLRDPGQAGYVTPDPYQILDGRATSIYLANGSTYGGLEDIVLDGNYLGQSAFMSGTGGITFDEKETHMRNSPGFAGFVSTNHGNVSIPVGQQVVLTNVAITGFGNTSILGYQNNTWTGTNVLIGNIIWNHAGYSPNGTWTNLTITGFAWTHVVWQSGTITNFVYEGGAEGPSWTSPHNAAPDAWNIRAADDWDESTVTDGRLIRTDGTLIPLTTLIDGFFFDLRDSRLQNPFNGIGFDITIQDGAVVTNQNYNWSSLFYRNGNNPQGIYPDNAIERVKVFAAGATGERLYGTTDLSRSIVRDVEVINARPAPTKASIGALADFRSLNRSDPSWLNDKEFTMQGVDMRDISSTFYLTVNIWSSANKPTRVNLIDCHVRNTSATLFRGPAGTGVLSTLQQVQPDYLPIYQRACSFNIKGSSFQDTEIFWALSYFDNCTDAASGRTSESAGTFTTTTPGNVHIIPTSLFWQPHATRGTLNVSIPGVSVSSTSWTNAAGSPLSTDKRAPYLRVTTATSVPAGTVITWAAAVAPWPAPALTTGTATGSMALPTGFARQQGVTGAAAGAMATPSGYARTLATVEGTAAGAMEVPTGFAIVSVQLGGSATGVMETPGGVAHNYPPMVIVDGVIERERAWIDVGPLRTATGSISTLRPVRTSSIKPLRPSVGAIIPE